MRLDDDGKDNRMGDRRLRQCGGVFLLGLLISCSQTATSNSPVPIASPAPFPAKQLEYNLHQQAGAIVHTLKIPADSQFIVTTAIANPPQTVEEFAASTQAIAVLNGGFFDPKNQKSTSAVFQNGKQVAKPEDNERLMTNPDLLPYLDKILNRSEFRRYQCGAIVQYDIAFRQGLPPGECQLQDALGAGPQLLPFLTSVPEGFLVVENGQTSRDALGQNQPNARSAIGLLRDGSILWVLVAQRPQAANSGLSLPELAEFMKKMGVEKGLNLDGGSSTSMFFQGETFYGKVNSAGDAIARPVKSVLLVQHTKKPEVPPR
ncbi:MAG: phosphodiester glycosidase family protein [Leptolyngbyaceae cyanobacterium bins.349]|nr:phosphodiester glycosidase family protein [Leptolyngbyaceae cyanobacterium bins.349]